MNSVSNARTAMGNPRIIFVNRVYRPSIEATAQLLTDLAEGLAARGWPVHVIAAGVAENGPLSGVTIHRTGPGDKNGGLLSRTANYLGFLRAARRILSTLAEPGDSVVLMTDPPLLAACATGTAHRRGARVLHWIQDIYPEIVPQHIGAWAGLPLLPLKWARNRAWRSASLCLPVGTDMRTTVEAQGVRASQIVVVSNWAPQELDCMPADNAVTAYRKKQNLPTGFIVGYSGNLGRVHEFDTFLSAAQRLRTGDASPACTFRITGSGPQLPGVIATKTERQLENILIAAPVPRTDLTLSLAACHAHLVTLKPGFESLVNPSKLTGILAAGRPVLFVGPPRSALATFINEERIGAVFAPGDATALAATIQRWSANGGAEAAVIGRTARTCYERHFTLGAGLDHWEGLLRPVNSARG
jgi:glycosyltransferase involved in cell wall biosynthesis